ncbi:MAG: hypothetical protein ABI323_14100 [Solirubrobacteraceae bacterium]
MTWARGIALGMGVGLSLVGCGSSATTQSVLTRNRTTATGPPATSAAVPHHRRHHRRARPPAPDPGTLPQTAQVPSSHTRAFHGEMRDLWRAILTDQTMKGRAAFFPETAYAQVKSIGDAAADWEDRLFADYRFDIEAAHQLLGAAPPSTQLIGVIVPAAYAHWVGPGACLNRVGYEEVPNSRIVYRENGEVRSFGIASMISWRGRWYVIHLGYVGKLSIGGRVDDPSTGQGVSVPSSTC